MQSRLYAVAKRNPFRYFNSSPEVIRLTVMSTICFGACLGFRAGSIYLQTRGKRAWRRATSYTRRSLIEAGIPRYKRIIGRCLRTRSLAAQQAETRIGVQVLNQMLDLGRPITEWFA